MRFGGFPVKIRDHDLRRRGSKFGMPDALLTRGCVLAIVWSWFLPDFEQGEDCAAFATFPDRLKSPLWELVWGASSGKRGGWVSPNSDPTPRLQEAEAQEKCPGRAGFGVGLG